MFTKVIVCALLSLSAVNAAPVAAVDRRDIVNGLTSAFGKATSIVGSMLSEGTAGVASGMLAKEASKAYKSATSELGTATASVHATVTTVSGVPIVEVTSVGGPAITLALPGPGKHTRHPVTTTFAGHTFLVPSASSSSSSSSSTLSSSSYSSSSRSSHRSSHRPSPSSSSSSSWSSASSTTAASTTSTSGSASASASASTSAVVNTSGGAMSLGVPGPMVAGAVSVLAGVVGGALIAF